MYDHSEYEVEIRSDLTLETRLKRAKESSQPLRVVVIGGDLDEVSDLAVRVRSFLKGGKADGKMV